MEPERFFMGRGPKSGSPPPPRNRMEDAKAFREKRNGKKDESEKSTLLEMERKKKNVTHLN